MTRLNPALDAATLAAQFQREHGRMQLRDFLAPEDAEWTFDQLASNTPWGLVFNDADRVVDLSYEQMVALPPAQLQMIAQGVMERAKTQFQFLYHSYSLTMQYFNTASEQPLLKFYEFLNSPATLDWFRTFTGRADIKWAYAQATLYGRGHFLKSHSDLEPHANTRAVAFVLNFTKLWERDWGGYLQFFDDNHDVELAWRPTFNTLNVFTVPHDHSVEMVTSFATGQRFAITGWLRTDDPPGAFGRLAV
jgi:Rps23 Pro-64 3,4-dihydroxylase Tpa1-like proline 4-hydroxylase